MRERTDKGKILKDNFASFTVLPVFHIQTQEAAFLPSVPEIHE